MRGVAMSMMISWRFAGKHKDGSLLNKDEIESLAELLQLDGTCPGEEFGYLITESIHAYGEYCNRLGCYTENHPNVIVEAYYMIETEECTHKTVFSNGRFIEYRGDVRYINGKSNFPENALIVLERSNGLYEGYEERNGEIIQLFNSDASLLFYSMRSYTTRGYEVILLDESHEDDFMKNRKTLDAYLQGITKGVE